MYFTQVDFSNCSTLDMEAENSSGTIIYSYQNTRCKISEESKFQMLKYLKSHMNATFYVKILCL